MGVDQQRALAEVAELEGGAGELGEYQGSLLVDPRRKLVLVLLTNRAHPNWSWSNPDPIRAEVADAVAATITA